MARVMNKQGDIMYGSFISSEAETEKTETDERRSNNAKGLNGLKRGLGFDTIIQ